MTSREQALEILDEFIENENLKRHMYAVEAAMRDYALDFNEDPDVWGLAGLLHDFDWEIHPSDLTHGKDGARILRERSVPEKTIQCILSHVDTTGISRDTLMAKSLYACDEITGLITAAALVRPSKSILDLKVKSIKKKWKDKRFAAAVDRGEIERAVEDFDVELWDHVDHVLKSMQRIAPELDLAGLSSVHCMTFSILAVLRGK